LKRLSDLMLPAPVGGGFEMEDYWVWCGSVIKGDDGRYHMFASRWPKKYPMHPGWLIASEVVRASCDTPAGKYQFEEVVLPARGAQYWDGRSTHCPQITRADGKYVLYYTGMTHPFDDPHGPLHLDDPRVIVARSNKRVGIAVSDSVFGPWQRFDKPVLDTMPDRYDNFLTTDAVPCRMPDGKMLVVYKSIGYKDMPYEKNAPDGKLWGKMRLGAVIADRADGDYTTNRKDTPLLPDERYIFEDPFVWHNADGYHMMAKDMSGDFCGEFMGGVYGHSQDGLNWEFKKDYLYYTRSILWDDGVVREMGNLDRPFLLFEDGKPTHVFFATCDGKNGDGFTRCSKTWNMVIPLKPE